MHSYLAVGSDRNFSHLRDKTADGFHGSDTSKASRGQRFAPFGFLGRDLQNISQTRRSSEKLAPENVRVPLDGDSELVY